MILILNDLLDGSALREVRKVANAGTFNDGAKTAGVRARRVKKNLQLDREAEGADAIKKTIVGKLRDHELVRAAVLPKAIRPPLISRYTTGMEYGWHVDDALMGSARKERTDLSVTLFLSGPETYDGGELVVEWAGGSEEIKLPAGSAVVYPSGALHRVAPVTRGERLAAVTWIESYVRDPGKREILHDLHQVRRALAKSAPDSRETDLAFKAYSSLLRRWAET